MNKEEYVKSVKGMEIDVVRKKEISELFGYELDDILAKVISLADKIDFFDEERRALSYEEIKGASEILGVDAVSRGIIPVIDAYDCTYIVYEINNKKWAKFNTVDKVIFKERENLEEVV